MFRKKEGRSWRQVVLICLFSYICLQDCVCTRGVIRLTCCGNRCGACRFEIVCPLLYILEGGVRDEVGHERSTFARNPPTGVDPHEIELPC